MPTETGLAAILAPSVPYGVIWAYAGATAPTGWMLCDGTAISRTVYVDLFTIIGTTYGVGDGSTTFNIPDLKGRVVVGAGAGAGLTIRARGDQSGEETHQLTVAELAAHTHFVYRREAGGSGNYYTSMFLGTDDATGSTGSDTPHNNMQPYTVVNYIIKV